MFKKKDTRQPIHEVRVYGTGADWSDGRWYAFVPDLGGLLPFVYPNRYDLQQDVRWLLRELEGGDPWGGLATFTPATAAEVVAAGIEL